MNNSIVQKIQKNIQKGEQNSPFLLISQNHTDCTLELNGIIGELQELYSLPSSYIFRLENNEEKLKVQGAREIIEKSSIRPHYDIQIFVIENISRMTIGFSNSLLKFLEEPWLWNVVFLTSTSQSGVLDTVLSRVQTIVLPWWKKEVFTQGIENMIENYAENNNSEILGYYFSKQIEKQDAIDFLYALISYIKKSGKYSHLLEKIDTDIRGLSTNNFLPKYIIDRYLLALQ